MKTPAAMLLLISAFSLVLNGCAPSVPSAPVPSGLTPQDSQPSPTAPAATQSSIPPTPTVTPMPEGITIVVTINDDEGPGSFRQALYDAQAGDTVLFDPVAFPPEDPATITLEGPLPPLDKGFITIDASEAGVILDGSLLTGEAAFGLDITSSSNTVRGLHLANFSGYAIGLFGGAQDNLIGGDPDLGDGPSGQGNQITSSGVGINIWDAETTRNTIAGNFIGIDPQGQTGLENFNGIFIQEASDHVIGPDNVIAHNRETGITIAGIASIGNTITRNDIHSNAWFDISLQDGGNHELQPPMIVGLNPATGRVAGLTCAACKLEFFSVQDDGNLLYEDSSESDAQGYFEVTTPMFFQGASVTLTVTGVDGSTSELGIPTTGSERVLRIQSANDSDFSLIASASGTQIADNGIGNFWSLADAIDTQETADSMLEWFDTVGLKWTFLSLDYMDWVEVASPDDFSSFSVDPLHDWVISQLADRGITIIYQLVFWDDQIEPASIGYARFRDEAEIERYLNYARFIVQHFEGRIAYYQILNETFYGEGSDFSQQNIELADYINLLKRVIPVIREADPAAKIVSGSTPAICERNIFNYQVGILGSEIMPLVDAIAWHPGPYPSDCPEAFPYVYRMPESARLIMDIAHQAGFEGQYVIDGFGYPTDQNPSLMEPWNRFSELVAAKYFARAILEHRAMDAIVVPAGTSNDLGLPKMIAIRNLATLLAGADPVALNVEIESDAGNIVTYVFEYDDGAIMLALWLDGFASDEIEVTVPAKLTIPDIAAGEVMGIDILSGLQQQLSANQSESGLNIPDILIRDYPIILLVTPTEDTQP